MSDKSPPDQSPSDQPPVDQPPRDAKDDLEAALQEAAQRQYLFRLYVAGDSTKSANAIHNLRELCEKHLKNRYQIEVIDINKQPELAMKEQIVAVPTLVKYLPLPLRRMIGDLSKPDRVVVGLDLLDLEK